MAQLTASTHQSIDGLCNAEVWQSLVGNDNPFTDYAFLSALEAHAGVDRKLGWLPQHLGLYQDEKLLAACAGYLTSHSFGDFVYDWNWAQIAAQHGHDWYPKWVIEIPYSPVTGQRLHTNSDELLPVIVQQLINIAEQQQLNCVQVNYCTPSEAQILRSAGFIIRNDTQLHWQNRHYQQFDDFLQDLSSKRRKETRRERRKIQAQNITHRWVSGLIASEDDIHFIHACYQKTFAEYGNYPALDSGFFKGICKSLGNRVQFCIAQCHGQNVASAIFLRSATHLYGRYWGAITDLDCLHFETCFYQGIEYCIEEKLQVFEPGAGGGHKLNRGFLPAPIYTAHYVRDPILNSVLTQVALEEQSMSERNKVHIASHSPMRQS